MIRGLAFFTTNKKSHADHKGIKLACDFFGGEESLRLRFLLSCRHPPVLYIKEEKVGQAVNVYR